MDWFFALPKELQNEAYRFNDENAWATRNADDVLARLKKLGLPVLGAEVWLPAAERPLITGYQFSVRPKAGESRERRSLARGTSGRHGSPGGYGFSTRSVMSQLNSRWRPPSATVGAMPGFRLMAGLEEAHRPKCLHRGQASEFRCPARAVPTVVVHLANLWPTADTTPGAPTPPDRLEALRRASDQ